MTIITTNVIIPVTIINLLEDLDLEYCDGLECTGSFEWISHKTYPLT